MTTENIDYVAIIADLEAKRAAIDNAIASLRAVAGMGAIGNQDGITIDTSMPYSASGGRGIPDGAFHGMTLPEGIRIYLGLMRKNQSAREITDGLKKGGMKSTSKWFDKIVYSTLDRLKKSGDVVKIEGLWGLPEWYPALKRSGDVQRFIRLAGIPGKSKQSVRKNGRGKRKSQLDGKSETKPGDIAIRFLSDNPGSHTAEQVQSATGIKNVKVTSMLLGTLAKKGKIEKTSDGKYRNAS